MVQTARPASDITTTNWTTAPLFSKVNDASDATTIRNANGITTACEVKLGALTDPVSSTGHIVYVRAFATGSSAGEQMEFVLVQGTTVIATAAGATLGRTTPSTRTLTLSGAEADAITNYSDLRVRVRMSTGAGTEFITVQDVWMEVPDVVTVVNLVVADGAHAHAADAAPLTQVHALVVADGAHAHAADAPVVSVPAPAMVLVQEKIPATVSALSISATLDATPTPGNLLVATFGNLSGVPVMSPPAGWATAVNTSNPGRSAIFFKVATASESMPYVFTIDGATNRALRLRVREYSGNVQDQATVLDQAGSVANFVTLSSSGVVAVAGNGSQADELAVAFCVLGGTTGGSEAVTNGFNVLGTALDSTIGANKNIAAIETASTTFSWLTARSGNAVIATFKVAAAAAPVDLVVADGQHAHAADAPALTQVHALAVADATHSETSDLTGIPQVHVVTPADTAHAHAADPLTMTLSTSLVVADAAHTHRAGSLPGQAPGLNDLIALTQVHQLALADGRSLHASDLTGIGQVHQLFVVEGTHPSSADSPGLTGVHVLAVADARSLHAADNVPTMTQGQVLVVADGRSTHTSDPLALTQVHVVTPADSFHTVTSDQAPPAQTHVLTVADGRSLHASDPLVLAPAGTLGVADATHGATSDVPTLTQVHQLVVADGRSTHTADQPGLGGAGSLVVADARSTHTADPIALTQAHTLGMVRSAHAHTADPLTLTQAHTLTVADTHHGTFTDDPIDLGGEVTLAVHDARHTLSSDHLHLGYGTPPEQDFDRTDDGIVDVGERGGLTPAEGGGVGTSSSRGALSPATPGASTMQRTTGGVR